MTLEIKSDIITGYVPFIESMGVANVLERIIKKQDEIIQHINKVEIKDRKAIREAVDRERKAWTAFAIVDPASNNYTYDGFFMTKKQAVDVLRDRYQGMKGLTIIEVDVVQALTPPTK